MKFVKTNLFLFNLESGFGRENGWQCFREYCQTQSVVINYGGAPDWFGQVNARYN